MSSGPKQWSCVNFVTIFGDLYKIKLWGICNNFNQFTHQSSASGPRYDVIKMEAIEQLLCVYFKEKSNYVGKVNAI